MGVGLRRKELCTDCSYLLSIFLFAYDSLEISLLYSLKRRSIFIAALGVPRFLVSLTLHPKFGTRRSSLARIATLKREVENENKTIVFFVYACCPSIYECAEVMEGLPVWGCMCEAS